MTSPTAIALLRDAEAYLSALHVHVARHDQIGADLTCGGCLLRERIAAALPTLAVEEPADRDALRQRIAAALYERERPPRDPHWPKAFAADREVFEAMADAVLAVLPEPTGQTTDQAAAPVCICGHPKERHFEDVCQTCDCGDYLESEGAREVIARYQAAAKPEPRVPDHTVNEAEAPTPVKQRADCTEVEWAEQERARFERLYTRETVRADKAEQRAETAARDAEIYQKRLERLSEGYTRERKRAEAMERAMESTAADALKHRGCHRDLMAQCLRAERAEAEVERLRTELRRLADEARPTTETPTAERIVAYVLATHADLHCLRCAPPPVGDIWTPVTADELEDGGVCARCGVDVLIPQESS